MPKYDAFGREVGEDSLAGWRTEEGESAPPPAAPAEPSAAAAAEPPAAAPAEATAATPRTAAPEQVIQVTLPAAAARPRPRRRRGPRVMSRLVVLLVVIGLGVSLVVNSGSGIEEAIRDAPGLGSGPEEAVALPTGLGEGSLIRPGELRRALVQLRQRRLGRVQNLRLAPERIDASLLTSGGLLRSVQLRHDGGFDQFSSTRGLSHLETIPWPRLDAAAPARLVRQAAARLRRPVTRINYLVPTLLDGKVIWGAYFKGGQIFQGDARGRLFRRVS